MSNQNLVPRTDKSGSIGVPTKQWGSGSFANLDATNLGVTNANLTGSFTGSFNGNSSGEFSGTLSGSASGSFQGDFDGIFTGDGSGITNVTALDTGSLLGIQRIYNSGSSVDDYTTISGALADAVSGDTIFVGAGIYEESDLIVKGGVQLIGKTATDRDVIINGSSGSDGFVVKIMDDAQFAHFEVDGPNNSNPIIIMQGENTLGKNPFIKDVAVRGGDNSNQTGIHVTGSGFVILEHISFITQGDVLGDSVLFNGVDGLTLFAKDLRFSAKGKSLIKTTGSQGIIEISGIEVEGTATDYTYGIHLDSDVSLQLHNFNWSNDVSSSVYVDQNSTGANVTFMAGNAEGSVNDVLIHPSASGVGSDFDFSAVQFRSERYNDQTLGSWSSEAKVHGLYIDEGDNEDAKVAVLGDFTVGSPNFPSISSFGEGNASILNMKLFHSGSGGWIDQTADAISKTGSVFTVFPDSGSGATWYVGHPLRKFPGVRSQIVTPQINGDVAGVWEYSSGSVWNEFNVLSSDGDYPYNQYGQRIFPSGSTRENNIRFNNLLVLETGSVDWTKTTVNGVNGYWVRYRLTSSLSQSPELERVKLQTNRTRIGSDGFNELFGAAEAVRDLQWHKNLEYSLVGSSPASANISFSPNISFTYTSNVFANSQVHGNGGLVKVPTGLNTSRKIEMVIYYIPSTNGAPSTIELEVDATEVKLGDLLNGTSAEQSYSNIETIGTNDALRLKRSVFEIDIPNVVPGEFFALSYFRDATAGNPDDNFTGNVRIVAVDINGTFWQL